MATAFPHDLRHEFDELAYARPELWAKCYPKMYEGVDGGEYLLGQARRVFTVERCHQDRTIGSARVSALQRNGRSDLGIAARGLSRRSRLPNVARDVKYLLKRNIRYQDDLVDQLFNSSEKRLARVLLLMAQFGKEEAPEMSVPRLSQETLAEMVGTTRSRVSFFMNRFRKLGFINYRHGNNLHVNSSLLNVLLRDDDGIAATPSAKNQTARANRASQPPREPGETPDKDRARRPLLPALPLRHR
jgi:hypothetical protein